MQTLIELQDQRRNLLHYESNQNQADTYRLPAFDRIADFAIGTDSLYGPTAVSAANVAELGVVSALTQAGISAVLTSSTFLANRAASFTFGTGSQTRTFVALNEGTNGCSSTSDGLLEITGSSGLLTNLAIA